MTDPQHPTAATPTSNTTFALSQERKDGILAHLEQHLGRRAGILRDSDAEQVHVDLVIFPNTEQRRFAVICTLGCSAVPLPVPTELSVYRHQEFFVCLPPDWPLPDSDRMDVTGWWPYRVLRDTARLPYQDGVFIAPGTAIPNGDPMEPYVADHPMVAMQVWTPIGQPDGFAQSDAAGLTVRFSQLLALTEAECGMRRSLGAEGLLNILELEAPDFAMVGPARHCAVKKHQERSPDGPLRTSFASRPGGVPLSNDRLRLLAPELFAGDTLPPEFGWLYENITCAELIERKRRGLCEGDAQPAEVIRLEPLIIAAHTDELDCVALLRVNPTAADILIERHQLHVGSRLLAVNTYYRTGSELQQTDVIQGPKARGVWGAFVPQIADFLSEDADLLARMKARISEAEWAMVAPKAKLLIDTKGWLVRSANPLLCVEPGRPLDRTPADEFDRPLQRAMSTVHHSGARKRTLTLNQIPYWAWLLVGVLVYLIIRQARGPLGGP